MGAQKFGEGQGVRAGRRVSAIDDDAQVLDHRAISKFRSAADSTPPLRGKADGKPYQAIGRGGSEGSGSGRQSIDIDQIMSRSAMISFDLLEEGIEGAPARLPARNGKGIRP
jgi:hypothetical protein